MPAAVLFIVPHPNHLLHCSLILNDAYFDELNIKLTLKLKLISIFLASTSIARSLSPGACQTISLEL